MHDNGEALRDQLVDALVAHGRIRSHRVERAFRTVDRARFVPRASVLLAYADEPVVTERTPSGAAVSSMSAPSLQASMLELARIEDGDDVLEIGSGGCNAALLASCVGPQGSVTSVDIDRQVIDRARQVFPFDQFRHVRFEHHDAWAAPPAPSSLDVVMVTVDCPWLPAGLVAALRPGGRLLAPIRINGVSRCVVLTGHQDGSVRGRVGFDCGFVEARGAGRSRSASARTVVRRGPDRLAGPAAAFTGALVDEERLLPGRREVVPAEDSQVVLDHARLPTGLWLWLFCRWAPTVVWSREAPTLGPAFDGFATSGTPVLVDGDSYALWGRPADRRGGPVPLPVLGAGPLALELAGILVDSSRRWVAGGRRRDPWCRLEPASGGLCPGRWNLGPDFDLVLSWGTG